MTDEELIEARTCAAWLGNQTIAHVMERRAGKLLQVLVEHAEALATENARLLAALDEDALEEAISNSLDMDWHPRDAARLIRQRAGLE